MSHSFSLSSHFRELFFFLTLLYFSSGCPALSCGLYFAHVAKKKKNQARHKDFGCRRSSRGDPFLGSGSVAACWTKSICLHMAGLMLAELQMPSSRTVELSAPPVAWLGEQSSTEGTAFPWISVSNLQHFRAQSWLLQIKWHEGQQFFLCFG